MTMLLHFSLLLAVVGCVRTRNDFSRSGLQIRDSEFNRFAFWPSVHNGAVLLRIRRENTGVDVQGPSEGISGAKLQAPTEHAPSIPSLPPKSNNATTVQPSEATPVPTTAKNETSKEISLKNTAHGVSQGEPKEIPYTTRLNEYAPTTALPLPQIRIEKNIRTYEVSSTQTTVKNEAARGDKSQETFVHTHKTDKSQANFVRAPTRTTEESQVTFVHPPTRTTPSSTLIHKSTIVTTRIQPQKETFMVHKPVFITKIVTVMTPWYKDPIASTKLQTTEFSLTPPTRTSQSHHTTARQKIKAKEKNATAPPQVGVQAVQIKDNGTTSNRATAQWDISKPDVLTRGMIVFGGFAVLALGYFMFYRTKKNYKDTNNSNTNDTNQFRYGVLQSEDRTDRENLELSRVPLTMESDDEEDEDLEIFDLEQKKKSMSYVNLQTNDEDIVLSPRDRNDDGILLDIEDGNSDTLINWSNNGSRSIL